MVEQSGGNGRVAGIARGVQHGVRHGIGVGALVAAAELGWLGASLAVPLGWPRWLAVAAQVVALDVAVGGFVAAVLGVALVRARRFGGAGRAALQTGAAAGVLVAVELAPRLARLVAEEQTLGVVILGTVGVGLAVTAAVNARYWASRAEASAGDDPNDPNDPREPDDAALASARARPQLPMVTGGLGAALTVALFGGLANQRPPAEPNPVATGPSVLLITIDGLTAAEADVLAPFADGAVRFTEAVSPTGGDRAANASALVGLQPLRHKVLDDGDLLSRGYQSVFEALADSGYPTAAFVSSPAVGAGSGLDQGFARFDDDWTVLGRGALGSWLARLVGDPGRPSVDTADRFAAWLTRRTTAFAAWVHLRRGQDDDDARGLADALAAIAEAVRGRQVALAVASTHGRLGPSRGDGQGLARTLYDDVVHVPLLVRLPGEPPELAEVGAQVRLMDVASTLLDGVGLEPLAQSEGVPLAAYGTGFRKASLSCSLVGQDVDGAWLLGVRNNGLKVIARPDGRESLYALADDPGETRDRAADHPEVLAQVQALLGPDRVRLASLCGSCAPPSRAAQ